MSVTVDVAFVHSFDNVLKILAQQQESVLSNAVRMKTGVVGKSHSFETLGKAALVKLTSRHQPTPILNPAHGRRRVFFDDFSGAVLIDEVDEVKMLLSLESPYSRTLAYARNRQMDQIVIDALPAAATNVAADDTTSTTTLAAAVTDYGSGAQVIANGSANLTMAKLRTTAEAFNVNNVDQQERYFIYSPQGMTKLLSDSAVTSSDFSTIQALMRGGFPPDQTWMGFKWRMSTLLPKTGNIRSCYAFQKDAVGLAIGLMQEPSIATREDLNGSTQVRISYSAGCVRIEDAGVVQVDIDESA